jgi:glycosyltransferase involved in cell wall biosynthesis
MAARRILYLIETLGHGGAEHQLALTTTQLDRSRFEPIVCHLHPPNFLNALIQRRPTEVVSFDLVGRKRSWLEALRRIRALHAKRPFDLIHTSLFEADIVGVAAARSLGIPAVATLCNIGTEDVRLIDNPLNSRLKLRAASMLWGAALRRHDQLIAISNAVKSSCARSLRIDPNKCSVIYRAIPERPAVGRDRVEATRAALGLQHSSVLLNVGRLAPQKGQRYLIDALPLVRAKHPDTVLLITGEGWLQKDLEDRARALGVADAVRFLGKRDDVHVLLRLADVFVFPSLFEGLGISLLEAGAAACPVVATNVGPIPEIFQNEITAHLVAPRDPAALAGSIMTVLRDPVRARAMAERGRDDVRARFSTERMMTELHELYDRVIGGHVQGRSTKPSRHSSGRSSQAEPSG